VPDAVSLRAAQTELHIALHQALALMNQFDSGLHD
jgi:hypothetical protein